MNKVSLAINTTRAAVKAINDYRERKAAEAYDALSEVAENYTLAELAEQGKALIDDRRDTAAKVAENARVRLEKARDEAAKSSQELAKKADKKAVALGIKEAPKKKNRAGIVALVVALLGAVGAALYWFVFREEKPSTVPPRVEEQGGSRLVYSTVTPTESEVDADFLDDLDKQLSEHKAQAVNDSEFAEEAIDEAIDEADVSELDSLEDQAIDAEKKFDER